MLASPKSAQFCSWDDGGLQDWWETSSYKVADDPANFDEYEDFWNEEASWDWVEGDNVWPPDEWEHWDQPAAETRWLRQLGWDNEVFSDIDEESTSVTKPPGQMKASANLTAMPCWLWPSSVTPKAMIVTQAVPVWRSRHSWSIVGQCQEGDILLPSSMPRPAGGHMMVDLFGFEGAVEAASVKPVFCTSRLFNPGLVVEEVGSCNKSSKRRSGSNYARTSWKPMLYETMLLRDVNKFRLLWSLALLHAAFGVHALLKPGCYMRGREEDTRKIYCSLGSGIISPMVRTAP